MVKHKTGNNYGKYTIPIVIQMSNCADFSFFKPLIAALLIECSYCIGVSIDTHYPLNISTNLTGNIPVCSTSKIQQFCLTVNITVLTQ